MSEHPRVVEITAEGDYIQVSSQGLDVAFDHLVEARTQIDTEVTKATIVNIDDTEEAI